MDEYCSWGSFLAKDLFSKLEHPWQALAKIEDFIKARAKKLEFEKLTDNVYVGRKVDIDKSAKFSGSALIGSNTKIGDGTLIRNGVIIGENCHIGHGSEIKHSVIGNNTNAAHLNYVGDSILGNDINLAAGTIIANYKAGSKNPEVSVNWKGKTLATGLKKFGALIGDGVKIGSNCVTNPGTIIGRQTRIYPLISVRGTIEANKIVKHKPALEITGLENEII